MKEYRIKYSYGDHLGWVGADRVNAVNIPYMANEQEARNVFADVVAAGKNRDNPPRVRLVQREVSEWDVLEEA